MALSQLLKFGLQVPQGANKVFQFKRGLALTKPNNGKACGRNVK